MFTNRSLPLFTSAFFLGAIAGCSRSDTNNLQALLDRISHGPESELPGLLFGYEKSSTGARQVLLGMLRPLRAPSPEHHMSVQAVRQSGRFTMIVARVPWQNGNPSAGVLHPIITTGKLGREQVVGYVLPFNDVFPLLQGTDLQNATELGQWWAEYAKKSKAAL